MSVPEELLEDFTLLMNEWRYWRVDHLEGKSSLEVGSYHLGFSDGFDAAIRNPRLAELLKAYAEEPDESYRYTERMIVG